MAVGYGSNGSTDQTLVESWDGTSWSIIPSPSPGNFANHFNGISCAGTNFCVAVGYYESHESAHSKTLVETWDGTSWSLTPSPDKGVLYGISCTSPTSCVAVGELSGASEAMTLVESWDGSSWLVAPSPDEGKGSYLSGVSCTTSITCVGVGSYVDESNTSQNLVETWNGGAWAIVSSPDEGGGTNYLDGVSCTSSDSCMAVGIYRNGTAGEHTYRTMTEMWDGIKWFIDPTPNASSGNNYLEAVSCTGPTDCVAVGYYGSMTQTLVELWTGTSWSIASSPNPGDEDNDLFGVSCSGVDSCIAAGEFYGQSPDAVSTLVETGSFPPPTISSFSPTSGPPGTEVTIHGANLQDADQVTFDGVVATIENDAVIKIKVTVPAGASSGNIEVSGPGGSVTSSSSFTVT